MGHTGVTTTPNIPEFLVLLRRHLTVLHVAEMILSTMCLSEERITAKQPAYLALYLILVYFCEVILRKLESDGEKNVETVQDLTVESLADIYISDASSHSAKMQG